MPKLWDFSLPTQVQFGRGGLRRVGQFAADRGCSALLVGYEDRTGLEDHYEKVEQLLQKAGVAYATFYAVPPEPATELVDRGAELARRHAIEVVVGLGGGSVLDVAKGIGVTARMGGSIGDYLGPSRQRKGSDESLPVLAVPTTAGTGSEVSNVAVFTRETEGVTVKDAIAGPAVRPALALVDPDLTQGCPPALTAACGADALGHAIESCLSRRSNPIAMALAARAVGMIVANLAEAYANPDAPQPREALALAATLAGVAFASAGVVAPHSVAQALGAVLHVPHGLSVAIATRQGLAFNRGACTAQYADLARACHLAGDDDEALADRFVVAVNELLDRCDLPRTFCPCGIDDADLIPRLVRNAQDGAPVPLTLNPRKVTEEGLRGLFEGIVK